MRDEEGKMVPLWKYHQIISKKSRLYNFCGTPMFCFQLQHVCNRRKLILGKKEHMKSQKLGPSLKTTSVSNRDKYLFMRAGKIWHMGWVTTVTLWDVSSCTGFKSLMNLIPAHWHWGGKKCCFINVDPFLFLSSESFCLREHNSMYFRTQSKQLHETKLWKTSIILKCDN